MCSHLQKRPPPASVETALLFHHRLTLHPRLQKMSRQRRSPRRPATSDYDLPAPVHRNRTRTDQASAIPIARTCYENGRRTERTEWSPSDWNLRVERCKTGRRVPPTASAVASLRKSACSSRPNAQGTVSCNVRRLKRYHLGIALASGPYLRPPPRR